MESNKSGKTIGLDELRAMIGNDAELGAEIYDDLDGFLERRGLTLSAADREGFYSEKSRLKEYLDNNPGAAKIWRD